MSALLFFFVWGGEAILYFLNLVRNRVYSIYCTFSLGRGEGEVRDKVEGQQYTSIVSLSMGATVHKLG